MRWSRRCVVECSPARNTRNTTAARARPEAHQLTPTPRRVRRVRHVPRPGNQKNHSPPGDRARSTPPGRHGSARIRRTTPPCAPRGGPPPDHARGPRPAHGGDRGRQAACSTAEPLPGHQLRCVPLRSTAFYCVVLRSTAFHAARPTTASSPPPRSDCPTSDNLQCRHVRRSRACKGSLYSPLAAGSSSSAGRPGPRLHPRPTPRPPMISPLPTSSRAPARESRQESPGSPQYPRTPELRNGP